MKILIITSSNPLKAAGIVAFDLYKGLNSLGGMEVKILVREWDRYNDNNIIPYENRFTAFKRKIYYSILSFLKKWKVLKNSAILTNLDYFFLDYDQTVTYNSTEAILNKVDFKPDAVVVLFMQYFLSFKNLYEINKLTQAPILLYLMDMVNITGGCHYAWDCKSYLNSCGNCPALFSNNKNDQSFINFNYKKNYIEKSSILPIVCTEWQFIQLSKSSLFTNKSVHKVLLGIDDQLFKPGNKNEAKNFFHLPQDKKIIFFGAVFFDRFRNKGFKELIQALSIVKNDFSNSSNIHLAIAGNSTIELSECLPFKYTFLGYLNHEELAEAFRAADLFVSPSIEDSGPMMINQSIMSGTPVVAFEMGVAIDLVVSGETGYKAKLNDCKDLANGIMNVLNLKDSEYLNMSNKCRELGLQLCHTRVQSNQIMNIINLNTNKFV